MLHLERGIHPAMAGPLSRDRLKSMIVVIDYEMGNLRSVAKALEYAGGEVVVSQDRKVIEQADKIILPGVGAFPDGMKNLKEMGLMEMLKQKVLVEKRPLLGICLGMQLLAKKSFEFGETQGLGFIDAEIVKFSFPDKTLRVPHVGWDDIQLLNQNSLFKRIQSGDTFYFVHSYYMANHDPKDVAAQCHYGIEFTAAVKRENIFATQFHPEKSQENGQKILREFVNWDGT